MLTFWGSKQKAFCDGISRRDFLRIGALGVGGLTLAELLRVQAEGASQARPSHKSVIMIYLPGGPSHIDMYDLKPGAPSEFRSEFRPIKTKVSGIEICELMPLQSQIADKLAIVRGLRTVDDHSATQMLTGFPPSRGHLSLPQRPAFGSIVSRLQGSVQPLPPYVSLLPPTNASFGFDEEPLYVGASHRPFPMRGPGLADLGLLSEVTLDRLGQRRRLLRTFDQIRRDLDSRGELAGMDGFQAQALQTISSNKARDAFDISREPDRVLAKYGKGTDFLRARRLVEAGVRVVTVSWGSWDTHLNNFKILRSQLPEYDRAVSALVTDLWERGLDQEVAVVIWGEFGRQPRIRINGGTILPGRDHWPQAGFVMLAGGGLRMGQVIGATDARAEQVIDTPVTPQNVLATLYHVLGIDPTVTLPDFSGRPMPLLDERDKIAELI